MVDIRNATAKFARIVKQHGVRSALVAVHRRLVHGGSKAPTGASGKIDFISYYNNILGYPHGDEFTTDGVADNTIQWVIPNFGFGSGGHLNIFRFINMLSERGFNQRLVILPPYDWETSEKARAAIEDWYFPVHAEIALGVDGFAPSAVTFATGWQTAYWVAKHRGSRDKFYFVQDFEPYFFPVSSEYTLSENTYKLGLKGITAGSWLSGKLSDEYGMECGAVSFGVDKEFYQPRPRRDTDTFNIIFYSRHVTPRRYFEIGLVALARVCEARPDVSVTFVGGDVSGVEIPFKHVNSGEQKLDALPDLYSQSDLALVLSGTNLSLLPLEIAACGCPVIMNDSASARWLLPDGAAFYSAVDPDAMAQEILRLIDDETLRQQTAQRARDIALTSSWQSEGDRFVELLSQLRARPTKGNS
ncbi:glycosyltransferase family 4 protein [Aliiroseovarius sp. 2305UL8-7]|uniref:glycosyltransferase family 4 protein n=1 Tax=Aliiroseovarius conchicola TaxID=3121637 RepID=UPI0035293CEF